MYPEEYFQFLGSLNESIVVYNNDKVVWANQKVCKLMKYECPEEIIGSATYSHVHPDLLIDLQKNIELRSDNPINTSGLWMLRCKDGSYKTVHSNGSVLIHEGKPYLISIFREPAYHIEHGYSSSQLQHDMLTPLTVAKGFLEILLEKCEKSDNRKYLEAINESCVKIEKTIIELVNSMNQRNMLSVTEPGKD